MEKGLLESKSTGFVLENESTSPPQNRHEIAKKSDSFPRKKETNPPAQEGVENETPSSEEPPSERNEENKKGPSPLEGRVAELEKRLESEEGLRREGEEKLSGVQKALAQAVSRYRSQLLASTPDAPESMVQGETVDEIDESFAKAKQLVEKVRRGVEERMAHGRLPAGAPPRTGLDFSSLSSLEKIRKALSRS